MDIPYNGYEFLQKVKIIGEVDSSYEPYSSSMMRKKEIKTYEFDHPMEVYIIEKSRICEGYRQVSYSEAEFKCTSWKTIYKGRKSLTGATYRFLPEQIIS